MDLKTIEPESLFEAQSAKGILLYYATISYMKKPAKGCTNPIIIIEPESLFGMQSAKFML